MAARVSATATPNRNRGPAVTDPSERWLPVPGYEGFYEVSDRGRVRSVRHMTRAGWRGGRVLKPFPDSDGYLRVNLSCQGEISGLQPVHGLVLLAFAGPPREGQQARHGAGGKLDNRPANLCWGTSLEQSDDKRRDGTMACGERQGNAKLTADEVRDIRFRAAYGEEQACIATRFGISRTHVSRIVLRQSWQHLP